MKKWLKKILARHNLQPLSNDKSTSDRTKSDHYLGAALPIVENQPSAQLFQRQFEENLKMAEMIESLLAKQKSTAEMTESLQDSL